MCRLEHCKNSTVTFYNLYTGVFFSQVEMQIQMINYRWFNMDISYAIETV